MSDRCDVDDEPPFLALGTVLEWEPLAKRWGVSAVARSSRGFLTAYKKAKGQVRNLSCEWRDKRRNFNARHVAQVKKNKEGLWRDDGLPTKRALALIMWAYHPEARKLRTAYRNYLRVAEEKGWT